MLRVATIAAIWFLLAGSPALAQQVSCLRRNVLVSVTDEKGQVPSGLTAENVRGSFRGQAVQIHSVEERTIFPRIVILLDTSRSMGGSEETKWKLATTLAANPALAFHERAPLALVVFGDEVQVAVPFGQPRQAIIETVAALRRRGARGATSIHTAILKALELLQPRRPGDVIYLISDAGTNDLRRNSEVLERAFLESKVRLFAAIVYETGFREMAPEEIGGPEALFNLAWTSGGDAIPDMANSPGLGGAIITRQDLSAAVDRLYHQMWELHRLDIELPLEVDKPRAWKLELVSSPSLSTKNLRISYPRKLLPCPASGN